MDATFPRFATRESGQCTALLIADGSRCPFARIESLWCARHLAQHRLLHGELLHGVEGDPHKWVMTCGHMGASRDHNLSVYNRIQALLALRVVITHVLWAGNEDDEHRAAVKTSRRDRANLGLQLAFQRCDESACVSVSSLVDDLVVRAETAAPPPALPDGTVIPVAPANELTQPAPFDMRAFLSDIVQARIGDRPPLKPPEPRVPWGEENEPGADPSTAW